MCGIVAYIGRRQASPILLEGLKRLEYRGYDSAGVAVMEGGKLNVAKAVGRVRNVEELIEKQGNFNGTIGIAYSQSLSASGGSTPYAWSTVSGTWPAGLTLSSAGVVSGTPTTRMSWRNFDAGMGLVESYSK
jgi:glutamine phosphoribosylpyrophosphate amidotransferase